MGNRYYLKELVSNHVRDSKGVVIPFVALGDDRGYLVLDEVNDVNTIQDLDKMREERTGGIIPSTADGVEDAKKKYPYVPFASPLEQLRVYNPKQELRPRPEGVAEAKSQPPMPPTIPAPPIPDVVMQTLGISPPETNPFEAPAPAPVVKPRIGRPKKVVSTA